MNVSVVRSKSGVKGLFMFRPPLPTPIRGKVPRTHSAWRVQHNGHAAQLSRTPFLSTSFSLEWGKGGGRKKKGAPFVSAMGHKGRRGERRTCWCLLEKWTPMIMIVLLHRLVLGQALVGKFAIPSGEKARKTFAKRRTSLFL